jgi:RNA polymerase sigma factor (sigma-70 family)
MSPPHSKLTATELTEQDRWFAEEVQPHMSSLRSYVRNAFPSVSDADDVVQESFVRIWKARAAYPIRSARAFLFGVARRLAVDVIRRDKSKLHEEMNDSHALVALDEERGVSEGLSIRDEMHLLIEAIDALPVRCREIVILRKLDGLSHREIADRLNISTRTVQEQVGRGMDKVAHCLRRHGICPAKERALQRSKP